MTITHCPHCGGELVEPERIKPEGCVCDAEEWKLTILPTVCHKFLDDGFDQCVWCEHGRECHKA